jgi:cell division protein FtsL
VKLGVLVMMVLLSSLLFLTAVGIVVARHEVRQAFAEHQAELRNRDELNLVWMQLQLEQATWAAQARIEQTAREQLQMQMPKRDQMRFVEVPAWAR